MVLGWLWFWVGFGLGFGLGLGCFFGVFLLVVVEGCCLAVLCRGWVGII